MDLRKFMIAALAVSATAAIAHGNKQTSAQTSSNPSSTVTAQADGSSGQGMQQDESTVRQAQQALNDKGYNVSADGQWGPKSKAAAKKFQQAQGIEQSGQLDSQTLAALNINASSQSSTDTSSFSPSNSQSSSSEPAQSSGAASSSDNNAQSSSSSTPSTPSQTSSSSYK